MHGWSAISRLRLSHPSGLLVSPRNRIDFRALPLKRDLSMQGGRDHWINEVVGDRTGPGVGLFEQSLFLVAVVR